MAFKMLSIATLVLATGCSATTGSTSTFAPILEPPHLAIASSRDEAAPRTVAPRAPEHRRSEYRGSMEGVEGRALHRARECTRCRGDAGESLPRWR